MNDPKDKRSRNAAKGVVIGATAFPADILVCRSADADSKDSHQLGSYTNRLPDQKLNEMSPDRRRSGNRGDCREKSSDAPREIGSASKALSSPHFRRSLQRIVTRFTPDVSLQEDLMQECLIRLWSLDCEGIRGTSSWYLQNCYFHLQHRMCAGRSLDSLKRDVATNRLAIDGVDESLPNCLHCNDDPYEEISVRDLICTLGRLLPPREKAVLDGLIQGLQLRDVAAKCKFSYPTALKLRRKIAALAVRLGVMEPKRINRGRPSSRGTNGRNKKNSASPIPLGPQVPPPETCFFPHQSEDT